MVFENILDPVFRPLLGLDPLFAIVLVAFVITLAITLVYKYATDQQRMGELKKKSKEYQKKMRAVRDNPDKLMKLQKEAMTFNMELMKHSFKPTLYTLIPIIIIFGWLNANMAFYNIAPGEQFTVTGTFAEGVTEATLSAFPEDLRIIDQVRQDVIDRQATWTLEGKVGLYKATIAAANDEAEKQLLIAEERRYEPPFETYKGAIKSIEVNNRPLKPLGSFSLFGWRPGWLGTYIIVSIIFSFALRKLLKVV